MGRMLEHLLNRKFDICYENRNGKEGRREEIKVTHQILLVTNCQINWIKGDASQKARAAHKKSGKAGRGRRKRKITYTSHSIRTANFRRHLQHCSQHMNNFRPSYVKHFAELASGC